jgi:hypothetical protein
MGLCFSECKRCEYVRLLFAYTDLMFASLPGNKCFVVKCKRCRRNVPSGVREFPFQPVVVACPLCGELRRYLPAEVFLGKAHVLVTTQARHEQN